MYSEKIETLINAALVDGVLTDKERKVLLKRAEAEGIDLDEFEIILDAKLYEIRKNKSQESQEKAKQPLRPMLATPPPPPSTPPMTPIPQPKSTKYGDLNKCPACGAIVTGGMATCQECGYAFTNVGANRTTERLYSELQKVGAPRHRERDIFSISGLLSTAMSFDEPPEETSKKMSIISNFPVPNTRADLLDTLSHIQPKVNSKAPKDGLTDYDEEDLGYAYWQLYLNCINKAKISFANDASFQPYFQFYEKEKKRSKNFFSFRNLFK